MNPEILTPESSQALDDRYASWLTKEEAARRLNWTVRNVERKMQAGHLAKVELPRRGARPLVLLDPQCVERVLESLARPANMPAEREEQISIVSQLPALATIIASAVRPASPTPMNMTLEQAAAVSGLPRRLLLRAIRMGRLRAHSFAGKHYIHRQDLEEFRPAADAPSRPVAELSAGGRQHGAEERR